MEKTKVVIIDEQEIFRAGVRRVLSDHAGFEISDCSPSIDVLRFVETIMPDIILLGYRLNTRVSLEFSKQVANYLPETKVIYLSPEPGDEELFEVIKSSTIACVDKRTSTEDLVKAIRKVSDVENQEDERMSLPVYRERSREIEGTKEKSYGLEIEKDRTDNTLTSREVEILSHIAEGQTNKQIALSLKLSEQTIKNHVRNILRRSNANDRAQAVTIAIVNGWLSLEPVQAS
jgi:two-component system, NarL family, response regulator DegU